MKRPKKYLTETLKKSDLKSPEDYSRPVNHCTLPELQIRIQPSREKSGSRSGFDPDAKTDPVPTLMKNRV